MCAFGRTIVTFVVSSEPHFSTRSKSSRAVRARDSCHRSILRGWPGAARPVSGFCSARHHFGGVACSCSSAGPCTGRPAPSRSTRPETRQRRRRSRASALPRLSSRAALRSRYGFVSCFRVPSHSERELSARYRCPVELCISPRPTRWVKASVSREAGASRLGVSPIVRRAEAGAPAIALDTRPRFGGFNARASRTQRTALDRAEPRRRADSAMKTAGAKDAPRRCRLYRPQRPHSEGISKLARRSPRRFCDAPTADRGARPGSAGAPATPGQAPLLWPEAEPD